MMKTMVYARVKGVVKRWETPGRITHNSAIASLKNAGIKFHGAVMLVYSEA